MAVAALIGAGRCLQKRSGPSVAPVIGYFSFHSFHLCLVYARLCVGAFTVSCNQNTVIQQGTESEPVPSVFLFPCVLLIGLLVLVEFIYCDYL